MKKKKKKKKKKNWKNIKAAQNTFMQKVCFDNVGETDLSLSHLHFLLY